MKNPLFILRYITMGLALISPLMLGGCSSITRGVTEAVMNDRDEKDTRQCEIEGPAFGGVRQSLEAQSPQSPTVTKVLMVHGISSHVPGYSSRFQKKLYEELGLSVMDSTVKTITLDSNAIQWGKDESHTLGTLRVTRHTDAENTRQLIFYELTWSPITDPQKRPLEEDSANNEGLARASINKSLKSFMNSTVPDLLIYNGNGYDKITESVAQSVCWMLGDDWDKLPENGAYQCEQWPHTTYDHLIEDDHFFVTHSLGSRITIDTIHRFIDTNKKENQPDKARRKKVAEGKEFTVFMMANQLPLLQAGRDMPSVSAEEKTYCAVEGGKAAERIMRRMNIVAFSDPNDILSYPVPLDFASSSIDSRICPSITNVSLNVAQEKSLFDAASFANPLTAHNGYMEDERVIDLVANGIRRSRISPLIGEKCQWLETRELLSRSAGH